MSNLQIGSLVLNTELLVYLLAGIAGALAVRLRTRGHSQREKLTSIAWSTAFLWIILWKGSLLIFDWNNVMSHPQSLLFFDGGAKGFWLASLAAVGFMGYRYTVRTDIIQAGALSAMMASGWAAVYFGARIMLSDISVFGYAAALLFAITVLLLLQNPERRPSLRGTAQLLGLFLVVGMVALTVRGELQAGLFDGKTSGQVADEENQAEIGIRVGQSAPDFQVVDLKGNPVNLSDFRGQTVMLNFWTTWCNVCKAEMPHVEKLYEQFKDENVAILSVNVTSQERNAKDVEHYVDSRGLSFPVVLDEAGAVRERYRVTAYPTTFILDPAGIIRKQHVGAISYDSMRKVIRDI